MPHRPLRPAWPLFVGLCAILSQACGDSEQPSTGPTATIEDIQQYIFTPGCATAGCHDAETKGGELDLSSAGISHVSMVDKPAVNRVARANRWKLIEAGSPGRSFLIRKMVAPGPGEGDPMPSAAEELNPYYLALIEEWIEKGALR